MRLRAGTRPRWIEWVMDVFCAFWPPLVCILSLKLLTHFLCLSKRIIFISSLHWTDLLSVGCYNKQCAVWFKGKLCQFISPWYGPAKHTIRFWRCMVLKWMLLFDNCLHLGISQNSNYFCISCNKTVSFFICCKQNPQMPDFNLFRV